MKINRRDHSALKTGLEKIGLVDEAATRRKKWEREVVKEVGDEPGRRKKNQSIWKARA